MKVIGLLLVVIHLFLAVWSTGGYMEMIFEKVPWEPFTNPHFPGWLLVFHWGSVLFASTVFLYGYFTHWDKVPQMMTVAYVLMALVCVVETFGYMTSSTKYLAMITEYVAYIIILLLLYRTTYFQNYFSTKG